MKLNSNPVRQTPAPQTSEATPKKKTSNFRNRFGHFFHPTSSMELATLHTRQTETSQQLPTQRQQHQTHQQQHQQQHRTHQQQHQIHQQQQPQQCYATTGNRYNLDCHSCMLVQMGEKVKCLCK
mgnify:CR=1 FL=1